jgi:hypothetical protein
VSLRRPSPLNCNPTIAGPWKVRVADLLGAWWGGAVLSGQAEEGKEGRQQHALRA